MKTLKKENKEDFINDENNKKQMIVKENKNKEKRGRFLVSGIVTLLIVIILIDIYILANIGLAKVTLPEFDLTENKIYSLSEETKTKLQNIDNEVKIMLINYQDNDTVINFAEKYVILNNKITIEKINDLA